MIVIYEKCSEAQLNDLVEMAKKTFVDAFEADNDPKDFSSYIEMAFSKEKLLQELKNLKTTFYFVYWNNDRIGYFKLNEGNAQSDLKLDESIELERIYVMRKFQGLGLGETILNKVKHLSAASSKSFVWLGVWEKNIKAIEFYKRHGFTKFGTHPYYIGSDKQTDWLMRFDLINFKN